LEGFGENGEFLLVQKAISRNGRHVGTAVSLGGCIGDGRDEAISPLPIGRRVRKTATPGRCAEKQKDVTPRLAHPPEPTARTWRQSSDFNAHKYNFKVKVQNNPTK
jgi:hypothetical protein